MRTKLLRRIRRQASNVAYVVSYTESNGITTGMSIMHDDDPAYADLFRFGDTEEEVKTRIEHIYYDGIREGLFKKYKK